MLSGGTDLLLSNPLKSYEREAKERSERQLEQKKKRALKKSTEKKVSKKGGLLQCIFLQEQG